jgi:hypothetical protein
MHHALGITSFPGCWRHPLPAETPGAADFSEIWRYFALNLLRSITQDFESRITRMGEFHEHCPLFSSQIRAIRPFATFVFQNCPKPPTDLTPNANCGRLAKRRNPDQGAKCALLVNIQGPSLVAGDLNALGTGGCVWAEPILQGSALALLTLGTLFKQKTLTCTRPRAM